MQATHNLTERLRDTFGFSAFRENQEEIVRAALAGRDVFAVMPTGGGKSLCYQLPALVLPGTCIVISPLISLMKDQVDSARSIGIRAAFVNSSMSSGERIDTMQQFRSGKLDLLYMAPERLAAGDSAAIINGAPVSFIAIDEAHCISEWGHDFRPDYLALSGLRESLPKIPLAAFTATATDRVQDDIISRLRLSDPFTVRASFNRPNLFYHVRRRQNALTQIERFIRQNRQDAGIVYRLSRSDVEKTADYLKQQGIKALPYHAGLAPEERSHNQEQFNRDEIQVIVATVAFGMGIDKSNIRFVIHGDLPKNMEGYYQETGRAGRDGEPARCLLLYSRGDIMRLKYFIEQIDRLEEREVAWEKLSQMADFAEIPQCRRRRILAYFGEEYPADNCGACDVCLQGVEQVDATTEAQMVMSAIYRTGQRFGAAHIIDIVKGANTKRIRQYGHNRVKTYGVGQRKSRSYWRGLVDAMLAAGCIRTSGSPYPIIEIAPDGEEVLFGRKSFSLSRIIKSDDEPDRERPGEYNRELFNILRELRMTIARDQDIPPFVVFSDRSLHEMCQYFPDTPEDMMCIHGVGKAKLARYAGPFIKKISRFLESHPECVKSSPPASARASAPGPPVADSTVMESGLLARQGLNLEEIAAKRGLKESTVAGHIEKFLQHGEDIDIDLFIDPEKRKRMEKEFATHGMDFLKPAVEAMGGEIDYNAARILRGYLIGKQEQETR